MEKLNIGDKVLAVCPNSMTKEIYRVYKFIDGFDDRVMLKICKQSLSPLSELQSISDDYSSEYKLSEIEVVKVFHIVDNSTLQYYEHESFNCYNDNDLNTSSITGSVFNSRVEALEYVKKQAEIRLKFHQEKTFLYKNINSVAAYRLSKKI